VGKRAQLTRGFAQVPNIFIENLSLLIPAEIALGLLLFRRGGNTWAQGGVDVEISDETWERWTGLKPRTKEFALQGLREKCLNIEGQGNKAKIFFEPQRWREYCKSESPRRAEAEKKVRAKPVKAKTDMMVHPDCKEHGCQMLCGDASKPGACLVKPPDPLAAPAPQQNPTPRPATKPLVSSPGKGRNAATWSQSIAAVTEIFPAAGAEFVSRLAAKSQGVANITDGDLAAAVRACWHAKKSVQETEGLFLSTVPSFLVNMKTRRVHSAVQQTELQPLSPIVLDYNCHECGDTGKIRVRELGDRGFETVEKPCPKGCSSSTV
jgi:hypothetical protein